MIRLALLLFAALPALATTHVVESGEYLGLIAARNGCSVAALKRANKLASDRLQVGQRLEIPRCGGKKARVEHTVKAGDTLGGIGKRYSCTVEELQAANGMKGTHLSIGDVLAIPHCDGTPVKRPLRQRGRKVKASKKKHKKLKAGRHGLDTRRLAKMMAARGFRPPRGFKALVVEIELSKNGQSIVRERPFGWKGTADDSDWNPGSTVKLFAAIGALELVRAKGLGPNAEATFYRGKRTKKFRVRELVADALGPSDNHAYNRLVEIAGYDWLNGRVLSKGRGFVTTAIHRPYERGSWVGRTTFKKGGPKIVLRQGGRKRTLHARPAKEKYACAGSGACTTPLDLAEAMRRFMLHEQLPAHERFRFGLAELRTIRKALMSDRKRGDEVVDTLRSAYGKGDKAVFYHKPGFAGDWMSDVVYVYERRSRRRWLVVVAGYPGRDTVKGAAKVIGELIATDAFRGED